MFSQPSCRPRAHCARCSFFPRTLLTLPSWLSEASSKGLWSFKFVLWWLNPPKQRLFSLYHTYLNKHITFFIWWLVRCPNNTLNLFDSQAQQVKINTISHLQHFCVITDYDFKTAPLNNFVDYAPRLINKSFHQLLWLFTIFHIVAWHRARLRSANGL